jgi:hypothetical protein
MAFRDKAGEPNRNCSTATSLISLDPFTIDGDTVTILDVRHGRRLREPAS